MSWVSVLVWGFKIMSKIFSLKCAHLRILHWKELARSELTLRRSLGTASPWSPLSSSQLWEEFSSGHCLFAVFILVSLTWNWTSTWPRSQVPFCSLWSLSNTDLCALEVHPPLFQHTGALGPVSLSFPHPPTDCCQICHVIVKNSKASLCSFLVLWDFSLENCAADGLVASTVYVCSTGMVDADT